MSHYPNNTHLISSAAAAEILRGAPGVPKASRAYIARLCRDGKLRCQKIGRAWIIEQTSVIAYRAKLEREE